MFVEEALQAQGNSCERVYARNRKYTKTNQLRSMLRVVMAITRR